MCGRLALNIPLDATALWFDAEPANDLPPVPNYNLCPTTPVPVVRKGDSRRTLVAMRWGFVPRWAKSLNDGPLLINARGESISDKPAFRDACRTRRCLIPMSGFYEWDRSVPGQKLPWYFRRCDGEPLVVAGIWQDWELGSERVSTCAIVTVAANQTMQAIHHRMPVILEETDFALWLGEAGKGAARLMVPAEDAVISGYRVGTEVNSNRASGPELIEPIVD